MCLGSLEGHLPQTRELQQIISPFHPALLEFSYDSSAFDKTPAKQTAVTEPSASLTQQFA